MHSHGRGSGPAHFDVDAVVPFFEHLGLNIVESGSVAFRFLFLERMRYVLATTTSAGP